MSALLTTGIVLGSVAAWFVLGWKLAPNCSRRCHERETARDKANYSSIWDSESCRTTRKNNAMALAGFVLALWPVGVAYLLAVGRSNTNHPLLRRWLPDVYLKDLIRENEKRAKEMGL